MNSVKCKMYNYRFKSVTMKTLCKSAKYFLILALLFIPEIKAQSIDSLINEAIKNNPKLKSLQFKITASKKRSESVNSLPAPNFGIEFSQVPTNSINILNRANSNNFSISQMFPLGGKLNAMTEVESKNTLIEGSNYEIYKINLIAEIKSSYYSIWLYDRKIELQKRNNSLLIDLLNSIESSFYTNKFNQADMLTLQSEIASDETQLFIFEKEKEAEIYRLNKLLGRDLDSKEVSVNKELDSTESTFTQIQLEKIIEFNNPALKKLDHMIQMNKSMIDANNRELIPDLMLQGMFMRMPQGMYLTSSSNLSMLSDKSATMYSLMFSINLPFAPWAINKYERKEEELFAGIKSIEHEKNDMSREMIAELKAMLVKYNTSNELIKLYSEKVLPLYSQAAESQSTAYLSNKSTITTVVDTYRMLIMQEMNLFMAKAELQMAQAEIEKLIGSRFGKINNQNFEWGIK